MDINKIIKQHQDYLFHEGNQIGNLSNKEINLDIINKQLDGIVGFFLQINNCTIKDVSLSFSLLQETRCKNVKFYNVDFTGANLSYGRFEDCVFMNCRFYHTIFIETKFKDVLIKDCHIEKSVFVDSNIEEITMLDSFQKNNLISPQKHGAD